MPSVIRGDDNFDSADSTFLKYIGKTVVTSSTAAVDFTLDNSSYVSHHFVIYNMSPAVNNSRLGLRISTDGGSTFLATNIYASSSFSGITTEFALINSHSSAYPSGGTVEMFNTGISGARKAVASAYGGYDTASIGVQGGSGAINNTSVVDAVRFFFTSGDISSCTIHQYGRLPK